MQTPTTAPKAAEAGVSEAFMALVNLALARGAKDIGKLPGLYVMEFGAGWKASINGHSETLAEVPPFAALIERHGWPIGIIDPTGGVMMDGAEDALIAAARAALAATGEER